MIVSGDRIYFDEGVAGVSAGLHFDEGYSFDSESCNIVDIAFGVDLLEVYHAAEPSDIDIIFDVDFIENYSDYVDLMQLVPRKFRGSVLLQQLLFECGLRVGGWVGYTRDLLTLLNPNDVPEAYIQALADIVGLDMIVDASTPVAEKRRQLIQAIPWYKMCGTYQALSYIQYIVGLNLNIKDTYTNDYVTFVPVDWFVGVDRMHTLSNDSFEYWSAGPALPPDNWVLTGAGATVAKESTIIRPDSLYSAKLTRVGTDCALAQSIHQGKGIAYWRGKSLTTGRWVNTGIAARAYISIRDGVGTTTSAAHTGVIGWEFLTVTRLIDVAATEVTCCLEIRTGNTFAYFSKGVAVEGISLVEPGVNPPGLDNTYYKSPHLLLEMLLNQVFGVFPYQYLFKGEMFTKLIQYVERVRPVNVVPRYLIVLQPETDETGNVITVSGDIRAKTIGAWPASKIHFDDGYSFDDGESFDYSEDTLIDSIVKWKLGNGNKNGNLSVINALGSVVLSGTISSITKTVSDVVYEFTLPKPTVQLGISELGLYLIDGTTIEIIALFPDVDKINDVELKFRVRLIR